MRTDTEPEKCSILSAHSGVTSRTLIPSMRLWYRNVWFDATKELWYHWAILGANSSHLACLSVVPTLVCVYFDRKFDVKTRIRHVLCLSLSLPPVIDHVKHDSDVYFVRRGRFELMTMWFRMKSDIWELSHFYTKSMSYHTRTIPNQYQHCTPV